MSVLSCANFNLSFYYVGIVGLFLFDTIALAAKLVLRRLANNKGHCQFTRE